MSEEKDEITTPEELNGAIEEQPAIVEEVVVKAAEPVEVVEEEEEVEMEVLLAGQETVGTAHDDFNWNITNKGGINYSDEEAVSFREQYSSTMNAVLENEIVKGFVTSINGGDVVLDINYKSDGLIPLSEFRDIPGLAVGDYVDVYVEQQEDGRGQLVLSRRKAKLLRSWESIVDSFENGTIIKGTVISKTKGGLIVDCSGLETLAEQREHIIGSLEKGQVLEGVVKNITDFGAFLDLGGVDGLLYITDISWGRINHPMEVLSLNQKISVAVLDFDENKRRISLGLKQLQPHPWEVLAAGITEGSTVKGKIVNIEDYGAFLELQPGVEGLIHVSEVSWSNQPVNAREYFRLGQEYEAKVVTIDQDDRRMSLSLKQLSSDPWSEIAKTFPVGSRHSGEVKNLTPYGVFVELQEGIGGMVHISDLSWTKRFGHPSEFTKVGDKIDVQILDVDAESRKLSLGHKQLEENPWDTFENVFPVGSYHEATILRRDDRGAIVQLPYGLEAFAPIKHIRKEDNSLAEPEETLTVKVIEFNRDDKRILVSHLRYIEDIKKEAEESVKKEKVVEKDKTRQAVKKQQSTVEKSTMGELEGLAQLKEQLNQGTSTEE